MFLGLLAALLTPTPAPTGFQAVEDTYVDSQYPDANFGRDGLLLGGPGTAILIKFPELDWLPPGQIPDSAILTLHLAAPDEVELKSVGRIVAPWSEGADLRLSVVRQPAPDPNYRGGATWNRRCYGPSGPKWAAPGAAASEDAVPVEGLNVVSEGSNVVIAGLGRAIADMAKGPSHNQGLRIEFSKKVEFFSSEGYGPGPKLAVTYKNVPVHGAAVSVLSLEPKPNGWTATVQNVGDTVATGVTANWKVREEKRGSSDTQQALAPGDTTTIDWVTSTVLEKGLPDVTTVSVDVQPGGSGGVSVPQSELSVPNHGLAVKFDWSPESRTAFDAARGNEPALAYLQRAVSYVNSGILAQSRATYAPEGCYERVRLVTGDEPAVMVSPVLKDVSQNAVFDAVASQIVRAISPYHGHWSTPPDTAPVVSDSVGWLPDTRDDSAWPMGQMLPNYPWGDPKPLQTPLPARGLLSRSELAALNALVGKPVADRALYVPALPSAAILLIADAGGNPIGGATVEVFATKDGKLESEPTYKSVTTDGGTVFLGQQNGKGPFKDLKPDGSNAWYFVRVTREFVSENVWLPAWQLATEKARGNGSAPFVEVRLMISSGPLKLDEDLAQGKTVTDSLQRFPAELNAIVDGDSKTSLAVNPGEKPYWIDIDLGRDRLVGAVEIETDGKPMEKFEIKLVRTGQKPEEALNWIREASGTMRQKDIGKDVDGKTVVTYTSSAVRAKSLRITYTGGPEVKVTAIRVRTLQQGG